MILSLVLLLKYGIKINDFEFYGVKLEQLYIKLDKKLIVRAKQIKLPSFKKDVAQKASDKQLLNLSQGVDYLETFFQEISLESVQIGDDFKIKILFLDDIFFVDSPYLNIDIKFQNEQQDGVDRFIVKNLSLKDLNFKELAALVPLCLLIIILGIAPNLILKPLEPSVQNIISKMQTRAVNSGTKDKISSLNGGSKL